MVNYIINEYLELVCGRGIEYDQRIPVPSLLLTAFVKD